MDRENNVTSSNINAQKASSMCFRCDNFNSVELYVYLELIQVGALTVSFFCYCLIHQFKVMCCVVTK